MPKPGAGINEKIPIVERYYCPEVPDMLWKRVQLSHSQTYAVRCTEVFHEPFVSIWGRKTVSLVFGSLSPQNVKYMSLPLNQVHWFRASNVAPSHSTRPLASFIT